MVNYNLPNGKMKKWNLIKLKRNYRITMLKKFTEKSDREISDNYKELYEKVIEIFSYKLPSVIHYIRKLDFSKESIVPIINIFYSDSVDIVPIK